MFDCGDTIVALATPTGGWRGIVRLTGPEAWTVVASLFSERLPEQRDCFRQRAITGSIRLPSLREPIPATLLLSRTPRSYSGQDTIEVHTIGSPPLLDLIVSAMIARGARQALPGEFTMRAFVAGKLDLTAAEAVAALIDARTERQADIALHQLAGGIAQPITQLRDELLDLVAELEAGLDFADEDLELIDRPQLSARLDSAKAAIDVLARQLGDRTSQKISRRAVLVGPPNVGKSSLFNALGGDTRALVDASAGTTRDYLTTRLTLAGGELELIDTAGIEPAADAVSCEAQRASQAGAEQADLVLWCIDPSYSQNSPDDSPHPYALLENWLADVGSPREVIVVHTKSDLMPLAFDTQSCRYRTVRTSSVTGAGLDELRAVLGEIMTSDRTEDSGIVTATASRCRESIHAARESIKRAAEAAARAGNDELIATELRLAVEQLGEVVGAIYTDDILDRIFSRFCIGK